MMIETLAKPTAPDRRTLPVKRGFALSPRADYGIAPLSLLLRVLTLLFGLWTPVYHFAMVARLPAMPTTEAFLALFAIGVAAWFARSWQDLNATGIDRVAFLKIGLLGLGCGLLTLVFCRPNNDDFSFFHRVLYQTLFPNQPFFLTHTGDNVAGLPPLTIPTIASSYEPMIGLGAKLFGIDPLWAYQNLGSFFAALCLPAVYFSLYRKVWLRRDTAIAAAAVAMLFLLIDGNTLRSFGDVAFVRLWQGKTILWTVGLPLIALYALEYLAEPTWKRWAFVALACVAATGFSNAGIYQAPLLVTILAGCALAMAGKGSRPVWPAIGLFAAAFYPDLYALAVVGRIIPEPANVQIYTDPWPQNWWANLSLVIGSTGAAVRDLFLLVAVPLWALPRRLRWGPLWYLALVAILAANPLVGKIWMKAILPANYWRMAYLLPLPWCAGLVARSFGAVKARRANRLAAVALPCIALAFCFGAHLRTTLDRHNHVLWKLPNQDKLRPADVDFALQARPYLAGQTLLAPENEAVTAALLDPTVKLESSRQFETAQVFALAGRPAEGARRQLAQLAVTTPYQEQGYREAVIAACADGTDRVIAPETLRSRVQSYLAGSGEEWSVVLQRDRLCLFAIGAGEAHAPHLAARRTRAAI